MITVDSLPKFNASRLNSENRAWVHPVCKLADGSFEVLDGWRLVGWCQAPFVSLLGEQAIVYEKLTPSVELGRDTYDHLEPGFYWCHGKPDLMRFLKQK